MLGGVGHDTTVLATLVEDTVEQRQVSAIAGPAGDYARRVGGRASKSRATSPINAHTSLTSASATK